MKKPRGSTPLTGPRYYVELVGKALNVLEVLRRGGSDLRLTDLAAAAHLDKSSAFRILYTLQTHGYVVRDSATKKYRASMGYRNFRIGYAQMSSEDSFSQAVTGGLLEAAKRWHVELVVADNRLDSEQALSNAAWLIKQNIDFVIEYQAHYRVAPMIAEMFKKAGIPTMAIDIPQPGAIYFGADNYAAGLIGGEALGNAAQERWKGKAVDRVLLLEFAEAGRTPRARVLGTLSGIRNILPQLNPKSVIHRGSKGTEPGGYQATIKVLHSLPQRSRLLIVAVNDSSALGALRAVREKGCEAFTAIIEHGFSPHPQIAAEIQKSSSSLVGAVAYFPEKYGAKALSLAMRWLRKEQVPPSSNTDHVLVTKENISQYSQFSTLP
jgi:ribose transport system substrate-binding protein